MKKIAFSISILFFIFDLSGQDVEGEWLEGIVTFQTSQNIYVRFPSTKWIEIGDTLSLGKGLAPSLVVQKKSSSSCICTSIDNAKVLNDQNVYFQRKNESKKNLEEEKPKVKFNQKPITTSSLGSVQKEKTIKPLERIRARVSLASYSNFSSKEDNDRHRSMFRFTLNADRINNSKLSVESYFNYRKNFVPGSLPSTYKTTFYNIYNLALKYEVDSSLTLSFGRKINRNISSVGPIDGLQVNKAFDHFFTGAIIGFKPDLASFGFDANLFEYGLYLGHRNSGKNLFTQTTFGLLEQRNGGAIDRRYLYLQHSSTFFRKLNLFSSIELDVFQLENGQNTNKPRLSNLFVSSRYRLSRKLSFSLSYDARKRIIFYESLRTEVERLLADDETRQGIRGRINVQPIKYVNLGAAIGKRFQASGQNKSDNLNFFLSHSRLPLTGGRLSLNYNQNTSTYLESKILSLRHSRTLVKNRLQGDFYHRRVAYTYINSEVTSNQYFYGASFNFRLGKGIRWSLLGEWSDRSTTQNIRINTKLIKRFDSKK